MKERIVLKGCDNMDRMLHENFKRIGIVAELKGFNYKEVRDMIDKSYSILGNTSHVYDTKEIIELYLRALLVRLDMDKDVFMKYIGELKFSLDDENIKDYINIVGASQVPVLWSLTQ